MAEIRRIKGVKRIIIPQLASTAGGAGSIIVIKGKKNKRKKLSKSTKLFEKLARRSARVGSKMYGQYLSRHGRSNRKKKNGWLKDLGKNMFNSVRKGRKAFKLSSLF